MTLSRDVNLSGSGQLTHFQLAEKTPPKKPPGIYVCQECGDAVVVWHTPIDEFKTKCPKCNAQLVRMGKPGMSFAAGEVYTYIYGLCYGTRYHPTVPAEERARRAVRAKKHLVPAAVKATGEKGFEETKEQLKGKPEVTSPTKLAGWLKGRAKERGLLSPQHPYVGRGRG